MEIKKEIRKTKRYLHNVKDYLRFKHVKKNTGAWNIIFTKELKTNVSTISNLRCFKKKIRMKKKNRSYIKKKISILCAQMIEDPFVKVLNLKHLMKFCYSKDHVVQQWVLISLTQVFRLLLPSFRINSKEETNKRSKTIYILKKFEQNLMKYWFKYISFLRKHIKPLVNGNLKDYSFLTPFKCICRCFEFANHFNLNKEIFQTMIPFLNHPNQMLRNLWLNVLQFILKKDSLMNLEIIQKIVKLIRFNRYKINIDLLEILNMISIEQIDIPILKMKKIQTKGSKDIKKQLEYTKAENSSFQNNEQTYTKNKGLVKLIFETIFNLLKLTYTNDPLFLSILRIINRHSHLVKLEIILNMVQLLSKHIKSLSYEEMLNTNFCCSNVMFKRRKNIEYELKKIQEIFQDRIWEILLWENKKTFNVFIISVKMLFKSNKCGKQFFSLLERFIIISFNLKSEFSQRLLEITVRLIKQNSIRINVLNNEFEISIHSNQEGKVGIYN